MTRKVASFKKSVRKAVVHRIVTAARAARKSAQAVLIMDRTLSPPVEIEPRCLDSPALLALKKERQRLVDEIGHQEVLIQDHPTTTDHMADNASDLTEQVTNLALRGNLEELVKEIDRAIGRAERGTYATCERCGKPIADERLRVVPSASLCIDCAKLRVHSAKR
jgi:RNA polymerase-binding protein DksA